MIPLPNHQIPIIEIPLKSNVQLSIKREDIIHPEISGNKYWKLFYNLNVYLKEIPKEPLIITFGGAFSNHIAAVSAAGKLFDIKTFGIIRGEELTHQWMQNPTLNSSHKNGMKFRFVTRDEFRNKEQLTDELLKEFPNALIIPEGGTNKEAVLGIKHMLNDQTESFDYLCTAVGTGGTAAGLSRFAGEHQKVIGFKVVNDDSLLNKIETLSGRQNFELIESSFGGYGKISEKIIRFINEFSAQYGILLDPVYTGKMMMKLFELIDVGSFPEGSKILAFHTGGLQGIAGTNERQMKKNGTLINTEI